MIGCLCIHGFTGSPEEVAPLANYLRERTSWIVETPTLPGHGDKLQLKGVTYNQWITASEQAFQALAQRCDTVYVIGFSMGGVIAVYLAEKYPVARLVLLSAAFYYVNPRQLWRDIREIFANGWRGAQEHPLFLRYRNKMMATPFSAVREFRKLVRHVRPLLPCVQAPVLIVQGEKDGIVPLKSAYYLYEKIGSAEKTLLLLPDSYHHVCHSANRHVLFAETEKFLCASYHCK
ncbi:esterase/lipase [Geobacillus thermodenitrificans]|uniref:alpha/beta hydrolase n=1 Tax=Geobacillus thermodenitrificans TaxID=33940 RepID=UPI002DFDDF83|nr:esterase/lipase [Geobacillus thermodenitrificans]